MSEEKSKNKPGKEDKKSDKKDKGMDKEVKKPYVVERTEALIRIYGYDIPSSRNVYSGLTRIKGISWTISNAICIKTGIARSKKISELTRQEIDKIENFLDNLTVYDYLKNRRNDVETGKTEHLYGSDLDIKKEFDIKRLKKIKSYKGLRHSMKLPVRGQRTKSHFRSKKVVGGIKKKTDK